MKQYEPGEFWWRSSLTPEAYAEWKASMVASQLDEDIPEWKDGNHAREVEQKVFAEWHADDSTSLQFMLQGDYADEHVQLFLAIPWLAGRRYVEVFGDAMTVEWKTKFQSFFDQREQDVTRVIGESVDYLPKGDLRSVASAFIKAVWDFRMSYGEF